MKVGFQLVGSLWLQGNRVAMPPNTLRRARGISGIPSPTIRSRDGVDARAGGVSFNGTIQSAIRFGTKRFFGDTLGVLGYANIGASSGAFPYTAFDGTRLSFVKMPILDTASDYLFVAGGGSLIKVSTAGVATKWGIDPPTTAMNVLSAKPDIDDWFIFGTAVWTPVGCSVAIDSTDTVSGQSSLVVTTSASSLGTVSRDMPASPRNAMMFRGINFSSVHDFIGFWLKVDRPESVEYMQVDISVGDNTFKNCYSRLLLPEDPKAPGSPDEAANTNNPTPNQVAVTEQQLLNAQQTAVTQSQLLRGGTVHTSTVGALLGGLPYLITAPSTSGYQLVPFKADTWKHVRIPKSSFDRNIAQDSTADWDKVYAIRITVKTNSTSAVNAKFSVMRMEGGVGMQGRYTYYETFENSATGSRSNPRIVNDVAAGVSVPAKFGTQAMATTDMDYDGVVYRYAIRLGHFAQTTDPQVDKRNIWRTVGGGSNAFLVDTIDIGTAEYLDQVADYEELGRFHNMPAVGTITAAGTTTATLSDSQMYGSLHVNALITVDNGDTRVVLEKLGSNQVRLDQEATWSALTYKIQDAVVILQADAMVLDNDPPDATFEFAFGPFAGCMWWCGDTAHPDRVYYSAPGRPECQQGFIKPTHTDDATQCGVVYNSNAFVFTQSGVVQIFGSEEPYSFRRIEDVPGTTKPHTVRVTSIGVMYQAADGVRVFDGQTSRLVSLALGDLMRGRTVDEYAAFEGVVATFARDEYLISDGSVCFAYNVTTDTWRDVGLGLDALWYDEARDEILAADGKAYFLLEAEGQTADVNPTTSARQRIPFAVEFQPETHKEPDREGLVRFLFIEADLHGQTLSPTLILDNEEIPLNDMVGDGHKVYEFSVNRKGRIAGLRLRGSLDGTPIEITRASCDMRFGDEV